MLESEIKGYSIRLPEQFHNMLKAEAALKGLTKDDYLRELLILGREQYIKK